MSNTGVLPFVRGVDFTQNDFSVSTDHPPNIRNATVCAFFDSLQKTASLPDCRFGRKSPAKWQRLRVVGGRVCDMSIVCDVMCVGLWFLALQSVCGASKRATKRLFISSDTAHSATWQMLRPVNKAQCSQNTQTTAEIMCRGRRTTSD